ncbi:MAG: DUF6786 family protein [Planctomycetota bacterium]
MTEEKNFGADVEFLNQHVETIVLSNSEGGSLVTVPAWQGRTMTSSARGAGGTSYGWINYDHIASGKRDPVINLYGGEDRMWISPEGGQYSVFFDPGVPLDFANWRTPELIDTTPFDVVESNDKSISFRQNGSLMNYSRFTFDMQMDRQVNLLSRSDAEKVHGIDCSNLAVVAHESRNTLTNTGSEPWRPETGLISIWMLCMNKPAENATLVVPFKKGDSEKHREKPGTPVNADYFGKLDGTRLQLNEEEGLAYFLGDGNMRSKLGVTFARACPVLGAWDATHSVLTVVDFNLPETAPAGYTNNLWEIQEEPYAGDVINAYNDGPNESGGKLGGFFELETISPALALQPGDSFTHLHRTVRMEGDRKILSDVSHHIFGVDLDRIESHFTSK